MIYISITTTEKGYVDDWSKSQTASSAACHLRLCRNLLKGYIVIRYTYLIDPLLLYQTPACPDS